MEVERERERWLLAGSPVTTNGRGTERCSIILIIFAVDHWHEAPFKRSRQRWGSLNLYRNNQPPWAGFPAAH
jgi:hypothetical protein